MHFQRTYSIPAKPAPVFDALTSDAHLKLWFAEELEVAETVGGPFRFWGKHTFGGPEASHADQALEGWQFPHGFSFRWRWLGAPSRVGIAIDADGEAAKLEIDHRFEGDWSAAELQIASDAVVESFWDVAVANLCHFLVEGEARVQPDFTAEANAPLEVTLELDAPPQRVFAALSEADRLDAWLAAKAEVTLEPEAAYRFGWTNLAGTPMGPSQLVQVKPDSRLVHDWVDSEGGTAEVRWQLDGDEDDDETTLALTVRPEKAMPPADRLRWAWILVRLAAFVESDA